MRLPYQPFRDHGQLFRARRDRHRADHADRHSGQQPEQPRSGRFGRFTAARDRRGLRESRRVPRDRPVRLCDRRGDPDRWWFGAGIALAYTPDGTSKTKINKVFRG